MKVKVDKREQLSKKKLTKKIAPSSLPPINSIVPNSLDFNIESLLKNIATKNRIDGNCKIILKKCDSSTSSCSDESSSKDSSSCHIIDDVSQVMRSKYEIKNNYSLLSTFSSNKCHARSTIAVKENTNNNNFYRKKCSFTSFNTVSVDPLSMLNTTIPEEESRLFKSKSNSSSSLLNSIMKSLEKSPRKVNATTSTVSLDRRLLTNTCTQTFGTVSEENVTHEWSSTTIERQRKNYKFPKLRLNYEGECSPVSSLSSVHSSSESSLSEFENELNLIKKEFLSIDIRALRSKVNKSTQTIETECSSSNSEITCIKSDLKNFDIKPIKLHKNFKFIHNEFFDRVLSYNSNQNSKHSTTKLEPNRMYYPCQLCSSDTPIAKYKIKREQQFPTKKTVSLENQKN